MATAKKQAKRSAVRKRNTLPKKVAAKQPAKRSKPSVSKKALKRLPAAFPKPGHTVYIDSSFFFPPESTDGYIDDSQAGRYTVVPDGVLQAPLILPTGATMTGVTVYYKNTSADAMPVAILKKSINHYCFSGEVEVSLDNCPPGTLAPDNYLAKLIDHFEGGGIIPPNYLLFIQVYNTGKIDEAQWRTLRGIRIDYQY